MKRIFSKDYYKIVISYMDAAINEGYTVSEALKRIHKDYKEELEYIKKNGLYDENGELVDDMTDEQIKSYVTMHKLMAVTGLIFAQNKGIDDMREARNLHIELLK